MDQIASLKGQHEELEALFHEITLARDVSSRAEVLRELAGAFVAHVALEERVLHRAAATAPREAGLWDDWEARLRVERIVLALDAIDPADATFGAKVAALQDVFEDRIEYEETQLFPKLERFARPRAAAEKPSAHLRATSPAPRFAMGGTS